MSTGHGYRGSLPCLRGDVSTASLQGIPTGHVYRARLPGRQTPAIRVSIPHPHHHHHHYIHPINRPIVLYHPIKRPKVPSPTSISHRPVQLSKAHHARETPRSSAASPEYATRDSLLSPDPTCTIFASATPSSIFTAKSASPPGPRLIIPTKCPRFPLPFARHRFVPHRSFSKTLLRSPLPPVASHTRPAWRLPLLEPCS